MRHSRLTTSREDRDTYAGAEELAKVMCRDLWSDATHAPPWAYRHGIEPWLSNV
jgi:hypothetical protein